MSDAWRRVDIENPEELPNLRRFIAQCWADEIHEQALADQSLTASDLETMLDLLMVKVDNMPDAEVVRMVRAMIPPAIND